MQHFWDSANRYGTLSAESRDAWASILQKKTFARNEYFVKEGQVPKTVGFVVKGLFSQYFTADNGDVIIKRFFPEEYFTASISALLTASASNFTIKALEPTIVLEYDFASFKELTRRYSDMAALYIRYMELHWIIEKEPLEISLRYETAKSRYVDFLKQFPALEPRLKQHEIASYLGVTPTQLSRIRAEL
jgi:CRP-like cAMP-binding protein